MAGEPRAVKHRLPRKMIQPDCKSTQLVEQSYVCSQFGVSSPTAPPKTHVILN